LIGIDACTVPVLTPKEAAAFTSGVPIFHPVLSSHAKTEKLMLDLHGIIIKPGAHTREVLKDFGVADGRVRQLENEGVFGRQPGGRRPSKL